MKKTFDTESNVIQEVKESLNSIEVQKNSKGYTYSFKVYFDGHDTQDESSAFEKLRMYDNRIRQMFNITEG